MRGSRPAPSSNISGSATARCHPPPCPSEQQRIPPLENGELIVVPLPCTWPTAASPRRLVGLRLIFEIWVSSACASRTRIEHRRYSVRVHSRGEDPRPRLRARSARPRGLRGDRAPP